MSFLEILCILITLLRFVTHVQAGCPFQNPFWFIEKPVVVNVYDENGDTLPNKVRVMWGSLENFKCVDYFQVEYFQRLNPAATVQQTARINRHRRSVEVDVTPCTEYIYKVIASEDWKGLREDFKVFSEVVSFQAKYTPKFINPPIVKERGRRYKPGSGPMTQMDQGYGFRREPQPLASRDRRQYNRPQIQAHPDNMGYPGVPPGHGHDGGHHQHHPTPEPESFTVRVSWRLSDVDYPICLDYFELDYFDTLYNESSWMKNFHRPFSKPKFELEVANHLVPCELDYEFIIRAYGFNKQYSESIWTPPSCIRTTEPPSTTTEIISISSGIVEETTESLAEKLKLVEEENEKLEAKINGLKQEYEKIGLQVFIAFKESFFQGLQDFLARRQSDEISPPKNGQNNSQPLFA